MVEMQGPESRPNVLIRVLAVLCALLLTAGVAGLITVGDDGGADADVAAVLAAADKTFDGTARFTMHIQVDAKNMAVPAAAMSGEGQSDFPGNRGAMTMSGPAGSFEVRGTEQTAYVRAAGKWYSVPAAAALKHQQENSVPGLSALAGPSIGAADPSAAFELLRQQGVITRAARTGDETVRGEPTTVYRLSIETSVLKKSMPPELAQAVELSNAYMEIAIDGAGLVRRNAFAISLSGGGFSATITATVEYFDFGAPLVVEEPPAAEVTRLSTVEELQRVMGAGS